MARQRWSMFVWSGRFVFLGDPLLYLVVFSVRSEDTLNKIVHKGYLKRRRKGLRERWRDVECAVVWDAA
jgi:hypothetical protein